MQRAALTISTSLLCALICSCGASSNNSTSTMSNPPTMASTPPPGSSTGSSAPGGSSGSSGSTGSTGGSTGSGSSAGSGSSGSGSGSGSSAPAAVQSFVFVANNGSEQHVGGSISGFRINPATGTLTPLPGSPFPAGDGPSAIGSDPRGHFVFVAEDQSAPGARGSNCSLFHSTILSEALDSGSGRLTQTGRKTLDGSCARAVVVDPSSKHLYIAMAPFSGSSGEIQGFLIGTNGTLTELPGSPYLITGTPTGLAMHPNGNFIYAASDSGILVIDRNPATGALVERGAFNTPKNRLAINPAGTFLAASERDSNEISQFFVDPNNGNIEAVDFRPPASRPIGVAADPLRKFFAFTEILDTTTLAGGVSTFVLDAGTHQLVRTSGSPFASGQGTVDLAFDPSGMFLYAVNRQDGTVSAFTLDRDSGKLTPASGSPFVSGDFPDSLVVVKPE
jgi:6-phosphogluconolactonase